MKVGIKRRWINALRSGEYDQTKNTLCLEDGNGACYLCVLGVLGNLYQESHAEEICWIPEDSDTNAVGIKVLRIMGSPVGLRTKIRKWAGLNQQDYCALMCMNDRGRSFRQMANWIQKNVTITK